MRARTPKDDSRRSVSFDSRKLFRVYASAVEERSEFIAKFARNERERAPSSAAGDEPYRLPSNGRSVMDL